MDWMLMPLRKYAQFSGRSQRKEFWMYSLMLIIFYFVVVVVAMSMGFSAAASGGGVVALISALGPLMAVVGLVWLALLVPTLAVSVRRLHDTNRSGWWILLGILPSVIRLILNVALFRSDAEPTSGVVALTAVLGLAGFICNIILLVFYCLDGTKGPNRYGSDPKAHIGDLADRFS